MFNYSINQQTITIEGTTYVPEAFTAGSVPDFVSRSPFHADLYDFLKEWYADSPVLKVYTSGSTGTPKEMIAEKQKMMQSASLTCSFLGLGGGDTALLCMPLKYIAGKMLVVRALVAGLDLYLQTPSGNPLKNIDIPLTFAAMTPLQIFNTLQSAEEKHRLAQISILIIGGGAIDKEMQNTLHTFPNRIYSTYGMTETLSHIALRRLNGVEASECYTPFSSVSLSLSPQETLVIYAPLVAEETLYTNDIAELYPDGTFKIIGRRDNVINSGGVKIQVEELEEMLKPLIPCRFAISSLPDPKFGEIVVLVVEDYVCNDLEFKGISEYQKPKKIIKIDTIPLTETGKISRLQLKNLILENNFQ